MCEPGGRQALNGQQQMTFNGQVGDVFLYSMALSDEERREPGASITARLLADEYTVTAILLGKSSRNGTGQ